MAQTKARASSERSKPTKATRGKTKKAKRTTPKPRATKARKPRPAKAAASKASNAPKNGVAHADSARKAVEETAKQAGHSMGDAAHSVGRAASKAKTPLLAGTAAVAGIAGGIALGARQAGGGKALSRRPKVKIGPKVKIDSHDLAKAAKEVGQFGVDVGQLAAELRRNRESANANGTKRRSPIEVVLQGLTTRSNSS
jgi:hypothetical protein